MAAFTYAPVYTNSSGTLTGLAWGPGAASCRITAALNSDEIQDEVSLNQTLYGLNNVLAALGGAEVPMTTTTLAIGSTDTNISVTAQFISINGVNGSVALDADEALGALGTIPASTWGVIKVMRVAAGTISYVSAAANYTTGYASEALAIAAMPATTADRVAVGFFTVLASASGWVAGTDALQGGASGNPATTTNYYPFIGAADVTTGPWVSALQVANKAGTVLTSTAG